MSVKVFAPISIGNVSVGFDLLGMAIAPIDGSLIGDIVEVHKAEKAVKENELLVIGTHADRLPQNKTENIVWDCLSLFNHELNKIGHTTEVVKVILEKNIPTSSGLGSSACSVVAAIYGFNEYYNQPFSNETLLSLMVKMEAKISGSIHYDNVAPCFLGGLQLIVDNPEKVSQSIPVFDDCYWVMAFPDVLVSTKEARDILPKQYERKTAIKFGQNLAGFIDASYRKDKFQAFRLLVDELAEPHRVHLLPNYSQAKQVLQEMGCLAVGISGSGPTLFAVTDDIETAYNASEWLNKNYIKTDQGFVHICKPDSKGVRRL